MLNAKFIFDFHRNSSNYTSLKHFSLVKSTVLIELWMPPRTMYY